MKCTLMIFHLQLFVGSLEGANILVLLPLPLYSHTNTFMPIFKELAFRGHNVTMVSPYPQKLLIPNWSDVGINISMFKEFMDETVKKFRSKSVHTFYPTFWHFCSNVMKLAYQDETLQTFIKAENLNYDLVILEPFFAQESLVAFGHKLNVPVVGLHPISLSPWPAYLSGNEISLSLLPNYRTSYTNHMSLMQRIDNLLINLIEFSTAFFIYLPEQEKLMDDYMVYTGFEKRPNLLNLLKNVSLTLVDYHFSVGYVHPLQPNTIPVGGLSLKHAAELPIDLKEIMDNAKSGLIYLSFGSHVSGDEISEELLQALLQAFKELDQTILMKWEHEHISNLPNKPKNVEVRNWFPQASVLAHPNLQLFISHGGLHGVTEASYSGVPILGIPFFSDQEFNLRFVEQAGTGIVLLQKDVTKESLLSAIHKILDNPIYKLTALKRSEIVKDRPLTALESAVYWIEYVLKHNGARHLRPVRLDLSLYEILFIDVIIMCMLMIVIIYFLMHKCVKLVNYLLHKNTYKSKKD